MAGMTLIAEALLVILLVAVPVGSSSPSSSGERTRMAKKTGRSSSGSAFAA
jgi:hypothetical protein